MLKYLVSLLAFVIFWEILSSSLSHDYFFPSPSLIASSFQLPMLEALLVTLLRALVCLTIGVVLTYMIFWPVWITGAVNSLEDQFSAARTIPIIAATPLLIMWFGFGETARISVVALSVLAFTIGPLSESAVSLSTEFKVIRRLVNKGKQWEYINVVLPGTFSDMIGPLRVSFAIAFTTAVAVDFMGSTVGVGRIIDSARVTFNVPVIFLMLILSGITGVLVDRILKSTLRKLCHWRGRSIKS